jgi:hypothetical protein
LNINGFQKLENSYNLVEGGGAIGVDSESLTAKFEGDTVRDAFSERLQSWSRNKAIELDADVERIGLDDLEPVLRCMGEKVKRYKDEILRWKGGQMVQVRRRL